MSEVDCLSLIARYERGESFGALLSEADERITTAERARLAAVEALQEAADYLRHDEPDAAAVVIERACEVLGVDPSATGVIEAERDRIIALINEAANEWPDPSKVRQALLSVAIDIALTDGVSS